MLKSRTGERNMNSFWIIVILCGMPCVVALVSPWARKCRNMCENHRIAGKSMLSDYDEEQKEIDKFTR